MYYPEKMSSAYNQMRFPVQILLNRGLGDIPFGADPDFVRRRLGTPSQITNSPRVNKFASSWSYSELACEFFFFEGAIFNPSLAACDVPCLVYITVADSRFTLFENQVIGDSGSRVQSDLTAEGLEEPIDMSARAEKRSIPFDKVLHYPHAHMDIYLFENIVRELQWQIPETGIAPFLTDSLKGIRGA